MRIERPDKPIPYLNKRDRRRLMFQVALLSLVIMAIIKASDPNTWQGFLNAIENAGQANAKQRKEPDLTVRTESKLKPGEFRAKDSDGKTTAAKPDDSKAENNPSRVVVIAVGLGRHCVVIPNMDEAADGDWPLDELEVPAKFVEMIEDRTPGVDSDEAASFYRILKRVAELDPKLVKEKAIKATDWMVLMDESDFHRGKLVTIRGELRRLTPAIPPKKFGVEIMYHAYIRPKGRPEDIYHVVVTELPDGIPTGESLKDIQVAVDGYFFKIEGYETGTLTARKFHAAPHVLARTLDWKKPVPPPIPKESNITVYLLIAACGLFLVVMLIGMRHRKSDAAFKRGQLKQATTPPDEAIAALNDIEGKELADQLRDLAKEES